MWPSRLQEYGSCVEHVFRTIAMAVLGEMSSKVHWPCLYSCAAVLWPLLFGVMLGLDRGLGNMLAGCHRKLPAIARKASKKAHVAPMQWFCIGRGGQQVWSLHSSTLRRSLEDAPFHLAHIINQQHSKRRPQECRLPAAVPQRARSRQPC